MRRIIPFAVNYVAMRRYTLMLAVLPAMAQTPVDTALGQRIFESQCALCHGQDGGGGRGPNLRRPSLIHAPDEKALRNAIQNGIPPEMPGAWQLDPKEVGSVAAYVRTLGAVPAESLPGDAARGRAIYEKSGCGGCHILAGEGHGYGPELTGIASRRSAAFLRKTLLDPASTLPEGFLELSVNGQPCLLVNEDSFTLQCRDSAGAFRSFRKSDARSIQKLSGHTPMPAFRNKLTPAELDDIIAYLASQKGKS
jgi:cytochrome c oxidase cbb3-type subunit 3